jgi:hypothetical protein
MGRLHCGVDENVSCSLFAGARTPGSIGRLAEAVKNANCTTENLYDTDSLHHRNDKRQAAQHLLAASAVAPTDWLRYGAVDMTLARQLVDWGEREAVAQYLERLAPANQARGQEMVQWAAQLRQGLNPDLLPYHSN